MGVTASLTEPNCFFVVGPLCKAQFVHKEHHDQVQGCYRCTWHQDALGRWSVTLLMCHTTILDTRVKTGTELATDHSIVLSWICCVGRRLERLSRPKYIMRICWGYLVRPAVIAALNSDPQRGSPRLLGRSKTLSRNGPYSLFEKEYFDDNLNPAVVPLDWQTGVGHTPQPPW